MSSSVFKPSKNYLYRLPKDKLLVAKAVFDAYDENNDGNISTTNFPLCLRAMGIAIDDFDITALIKEIDPLRTGNVPMGTFFIQVARLYRDSEQKEKMIRSAIAKLYVDPRYLKKSDERDPTKSSKPFIPLSNLRALLVSSQYPDPLSERDADTLLAKIEAGNLMNDQGQVSIDDIVKFLRSSVDKALLELNGSKEFDLV